MSATLISRPALRAPDLGREDQVDDQRRCHHYDRTDEHGFPHAGDKGPVDIDDEALLDLGQRDVGGKLVSSLDPAGDSGVDLGGQDIQYRQLAELVEELSIQHCAQDGHPQSSPQLTRGVVHGRAHPGLGEGDRPHH